MNFFYSNPGDVRLYIPPRKQRQIIRRKKMIWKLATENDITLRDFTWG